MVEAYLLTDNPNGRDGIWKQGWFDCIIDNKFIEWRSKSEKQQVVAQ